ncbi:hypothetical protein [Blastomonas sp.]|uniref:hypothetical protein n=1 Tax=Blastomonas sp. TaxID=1909299 RepID=UPI0026093EA5|nr:hypothetical protein [Blastomonas sp.]MDM7956364.1 hypothetical protein [Blastomonas sp.]
MRLNRANGRRAAGLMLAATFSVATANASPSVEQSARAMTSQSDQPVTLTIEQHGTLVEAKVMSAAPCDCAGHFRIESQSGTSNRTANTSSFRSLGEAGRVLSNIRFGHGGEWDVKLIVSIDGREDYTLHRSSTDE